MLERSIGNLREARVLQPSDPRSPTYVFLFLKRTSGVTDGEYRNVRMNLLANYCQVATLAFPKATNIIGIASETGLPPQGSEDFSYLNASHWTAENEAEAKVIQNQFNLLKEVKPAAAREYEYPVDHKGEPRRSTPSRNSLFPCGSGERYKGCHGKQPLSNRSGRKSRPTNQE